MPLFLESIMDNFKFKLITRQELSKYYGLSVRTIQRRINQHFKNKRYFTEADLIIIDQLITQKSSENQ